MADKASRHQHMREKILAAAKSLSLEDGFENISLRAIARRMEYSPAGLYEYFSGKDAIIDGLCEETDKEMAAHMKRAVQSSDEHPLVALGAAYVQYALEHADSFQLLYQRELLDQSPGKAKEVFREAVTDCIDTGEFLPAFDFDEDEISHSVWSVAHGLSTLALTRGVHASPDSLDTHKQVLRRLITGLRG